MMRLLVAFVLACFLAMLPAIPAMSLSPSGSQGWSREALTLHDGPGAGYDVTGEIPGEVAIKILRCQKLWCLVDGPGGRGWTMSVNLDFGRDPYWPRFDSDNKWPDLAGGELCFYEGTHYTGRSFCAETGKVFPDLATWGWDNRIASIRVVNATSAALCRDRNFQSYCERLVESQPVLSTHLHQSLSSIRVY